MHGRRLMSSIIRVSLKRFFPQSWRVNCSMLVPSSSSRSITYLFPPPHQNNTKTLAAFALHALGSYACARPAPQACSLVIHASSSRLPQSLLSAHHRRASSACSCSFTEIPGTFTETRRLPAWQPFPVASYQIFFCLAECCTSNTLISVNL